MQRRLLVLMVIADFRTGAMLYREPAIATDRLPVRVASAKAERRLFQRMHPSFRPDDRYGR